jgi:toxin ParE1/3/4
MSASGHPYRLTPRAEIDLEEIWLYTFQNWSLEQADRYQNDIMAAIAALANGTKKDRQVDIRAGYLKYMVGSHYVLFSPVGLEPRRYSHSASEYGRGGLSLTSARPAGPARGVPWSGSVIHWCKIQELCTGEELALLLAIWRVTLNCGKPRRGKTKSNDCRSLDSRLISRIGVVE